LADTLEGTAEPGGIRGLEPDFDCVEWVPN
jgi:hypothetical protein